MGKQKYAHSVAGKPCRDWHCLEDHLHETAKLSDAFAAEFGAGEWGYLAGLWHDLGKSSNQFQEMLRLANEDNGKKMSVNHSTAGALWAIEKFGLAGRIFAYLIDGYHAVLCDCVEVGCTGDVDRTVCDFTDWGATVEITINGVTFENKI
jgi:CRISPR-associated endonuclease/helicase Cas3